MTRTIADVSVTLSVLVGILDDHSVGETQFMRSTRTAHYGDGQVADAATWMLAYLRWGVDAPSPDQMETLVELFADQLDA